MTLTRKNRTAANPFAGFGRTLQSLLVDQPLAWIDGAKRKLADLPKTNFNLGCDFADSGRWLDATFRFKLAVWLQPQFTQAWYNLGCCYMKVHKYPKAKNAFLKTLALKPDHAEAIFMLSSIDPNAIPAAKRPVRMQKQMVLDFFNRLASVYDTVMQQNQYTGPRLMFDTVKPLLKQTNGLNIVQLGCGTGLSMRPWRSIALGTVGVDFCPAMANLAQAATITDKPLFDRVVTEDILELNEGSLPSRSADVLLCVDTAQFLGDLAPVFALIARVLRPGALAAITVEPLNAPAGFGVNAATGRFGHHPEYVKKAAAAAGLEMKKDARVNLYPNLVAHAFVFAAKGSA